MSSFRIQFTTMSPWIYFWFMFISFLWCLSFIWMWQFSISCILFLIPFIWLLYWWNKNRRHCSLEHILKPFLHGYINMTCLAILGQLLGLLLIIMFASAFGLIHTRVGTMIWIIASITYYVTVEELLKLFFSLKSRDSLDDPINEITKVHTMTSTATALGYSMFQGTIWTFFMSLGLAKDDQKDHEKYSLFGWLFLSTVIIAVIGMPMHLITGYITGCKITQKDIIWREQHQNAGSQNEVDNDAQNRNVNRLPFRKYISAVYTNVGIRSLYLFFVVFGFLVIEFNFTGVVIAMAAIILDYIVLFFHAKRVERQLPFDYLQRAGQLSMFGYGVLGDEPDEVGGQLSQPEPMENHLDFNDNQVQITAASMDQFGSQVVDEMVVEQQDGDVEEVVVAVGSGNEHDGRFESA